MIPGEGAAHGSPRCGTRVFVVSMDTSVPRQRDTSDAALVDMLMLEAPVGLALFGPDLRFRWVNAALTRFAEKPGAEPSGLHGLLPSQAWPEPAGAQAEAALRQVLDDGAPLTERGYPALSASPMAGPAGDSGAAPPPSPAPADADISGCASWFPVHDATGQVFGVGLIMLNVSGLSTDAAEAAAAEIKRSEERYRALVQGGAQVVWVATPDGEMNEDSPEWRW